jgi:hypothetical protein
MDRRKSMKMTETQRRDREDKDKVREDGNTMEQQVTASNREGAWRSWKVGDMNEKAEEEGRIDSGKEERKARNRNGSPEERRKRPLDSSEAIECSTAEERSNKRSKSGGSESEHDAATDDLDKRPSNVETTPRSRTSPLTSTTASPGSILARPV